MAWNPVSAVIGAGGGGGGATGIGAVDSLTKNANGLTGKVFGDSQNAGLLGVGQFKSQNYDINENPFKDQSKTQGIANSFAQQLASTQARQAPTASAAQLAAAQQIQAANIDQAQQAQFREGQMGLAGMLQAQAMGQGPSLAQSQLQDATQRNIANQMAMAGTAGRGNVALAQRGAAMNAANINQQAGAQSAATRMQEQMNAQNQLGGVLNQGRGADIGLAENQAQLGQQASLANQNAVNSFAQQQAQMQQQAALANQQAALQQQQNNDAMSRYYNTGIAEQATQGQQNAMELEKLKAQQQLGVQGVNATAYNNASQARGNLISNLGAGAASFMADGGVVGDRSGFLAAANNSSLNVPGSGGGGGSAYSDDKLGKAISKKPKKPGEKETTDMAGEASPMPEGTAYAACGGVVGHYADGGLIPPEMPEQESNDKKEGPDIAGMVKKLAPLAMMLASGGGVVPGKAAVSGDSYANDKVPTMLSPGEAVIPRSAMQDESKLDSFVGALKEYQKLRGKDEGPSIADQPSEKYLQVASMLHDRLSDLEQAFKSRAKKRA